MDKKPKPDIKNNLPTFGICSALELKEVGWPEDFDKDDQNAFALALNITGSYEGFNGWQNLSNNFDGMGLSMGLLNQNLGSGTLQPLFLKIRDNHPKVFKDNLTEPMRKSLLKMLADWEKSAPVQTSGFSKLSDIELNKKLVNFSNNRLEDQGQIDKLYTFNLRISTHNKKSVAWAKRTLYKDRKHKYFKALWEKGLKGIAASPEYVTLQIAAAQYLHDRAIGYKERLGWKELRAYLFLFDIATQNGTLKDHHFEKFAKWLTKNPNASEEKQLLEMLEIRVVDSHPKWQEDVRRRKRTIIKGKGFVHGEDRNLPLEFCYDQVFPYPFQLPENPT